MATGSRSGGRISFAPSFPHEIRSITNVSPSIRAFLSINMARQAIRQQVSRRLVGFVKIVTLQLEVRLADTADSSNVRTTEQPEAEPVDIVARDRELRNTFLKRSMGPFLAIAILADLCVGFRSKGPGSNEAKCGHRETRRRHSQRMRQSSWQRTISTTAMIIERASDWLPFRSIDEMSPGDFCSGKSRTDHSRQKGTLKISLP